MVPTPTLSGFWQRSERRAPITPVIDTSVMVAGLVTNHEFHELARPYLATAARGQVPGIVLAETWAALRRGVARTASR